MEGRIINTLVIVPMTGIIFLQKEPYVQPSIGIGGEYITVEELGISFKKAKTLLSTSKMPETEFREYQKMTEDSFENYNWPSEILILQITIQVFLKQRVCNGQEVGIIQR